MKPTIKVVCGIICKGDTYFIARRKPEKSLGGFWEFPGGKVEESEDPINALERELMEELGMKVSDINFYGAYQYEYEKFIIDLIGYSCVFLNSSFEMTDHDKHEFVTANELEEFELAPADREFARRIINDVKN